MAIKQFLEADDAVRVVYYVTSRDRFYKYWVNKSWPTAQDKVPDELLKEADTVEINTDGTYDALFLRSDICSYISSSNGYIRTFSSSNDRNTIDLWIERLKGLYPQTEAEDNRVPVTFWTSGARGPNGRQRKIEVSDWASIQSNYTSATRKDIDSLCGTFRPTDGGQLILWRGEPGTGKTHAIRSIMWEWRKWATFHYIIDPDQFFGSNPDYMMTVVVDGADQHHYVSPEEEKKWRVLVLEDSGELLAHDAKQNTGQGLSRLLNVVDGMIGQGLKILILVTTNEELGKLHPAVSRPGRCMMNLEFPPLNKEEVSNWLTEHKVPEGSEYKSGGRLADLYAYMNDRKYEMQVKPVGFASE